jgi:hypothetical protein
MEERRVSETDRKEEWEGERESRWERGVGGRESCNEVSNKYHSALSVEQE